MQSVFFGFFLLLSTVAWASNDDVLNEILSRAHETESSTVLIVQNGQRVTSLGELYLPHNVQSITKSVASLAIAVLLRQEKLRLDDLMSRWIPEWQYHPEKSKITLKMILNHTAGLPKGDPDFFETPDIIKRAIATDLDFKPGEDFQYSNIGATLLQRVIERASGTSVENFINANVLKPLGITDERWQKDSKGHERTSGGLELSAIDLLKIGEAMLADKFDCNSILVTQSQPFAKYGLMWWLKDGLFYAKGWGGQFLVISREKNLIAIRTKDPKTVDWEQLENQYFHDFVTLVAKWQ